MAEKKSGNADGGKVPAESVELDGAIVTAAKSTMAGKSYEKGYPVPSDYLHMKNLGGK